MVSCPRVFPYSAALSFKGLDGHCGGRGGWGGLGVWGIKYSRQTGTAWMFLPSLFKV
jgi:hypothetical protein